MAQHGKYGHWSYIGIPAFFVIASCGVMAYIVSYPLVKNQQLAQAASVEQPQQLAATGLLTVDAIKKRVLQQVPGASMSSVVLKKDDTIPVYRVKLGDGQVLDFDAKSGKLVEDPKATSATSNEAAAPSEPATTSAAPSTSPAQPGSAEAAGGTIPPAEPSPANPGTAEEPASTPPSPAADPKPSTGN